LDCEKCKNGYYLGTIEELKNEWSDLWKMTYGEVAGLFKSKKELAQEIKKCLKGDVGNG
jgi:hypothetical protein